MPQLARFFSCVNRFIISSLNLVTEIIFGSYRHFPNLFSEHVICSISIVFIPRLNFKLLFCVHSCKFGKCLLNLYIKEQNNSNKRVLQDFVLEIATESICRSRVSIHIFHSFIKSRFHSYTYL